MKLMSLAAILAASFGVSAHAAESDRVVLPSGITPEHYAVSLTPDAAHLSFRGTVSVRLNVQHATNVIVLNAADLVFDHVALNGESSAPVVTLQKEQQTATFTFPRPLSIGEHTLALTYHGAIHEQASGLFALDYAGRDGAQQRALFTQFEAADARFMIPCWDEPAQKATFSLTVTVPQSLMAVSNMPIERSQAMEHGLKRVQFVTTPKMSPYLLFFGLGDFERIHRQVGPTDVGVIVKRGDAGRAQFALDTAAQILPYYNEYFGTPYPLPKLDIVGGPGASQFFSAMENWGAIFHFERALLVDDRITTQEDRQEIYATIAHEMAHQWFGDLVTMAWWDGVWLNEGFASWMETKASDHFHPEWNLWLQEQAGVQSAMRTDGAEGTHPIVTPIHDVEQANNAFDNITYTKGSAVIRMLEAYVGEDAFRAGVRSYMKEYAYRNSTTDELWRHIDTASPKKITDIAHDFTLQAGVPLISVSDGHCEQGRESVALSQTRFAVDDSGRQGAQVWRVPVQLKSVGSTDIANVAVSGPSPTPMAVTGCAGVLANVGQTGYFRTRYGAQGFAALLKGVDALAAADQLGLLQNSAALAYVGQMPMGDVLDLIKAVPLSAEPLVLSQVADTLAEIDRDFDGLPGQARYRAYVRQRLQPLVKQLGWDARSGESDNTAALRADVLATLGRAQDAGVLAEARRRFTQFVDKPDSVGAAARESLLSVVALNADTQIWDQLHQLGRAATSTIEKQEFYSTLGRATDSGLAGRALDLVLTDEIPVTFRVNIIRAVSANHPEMAMDFTVTHWSQIAPLLGDTGSLGFVPRVAGNSRDLKMIEKLNAFRKEHVPAGAGGDFDKAAARIRYNVLVQSHLDEVERWVGG